jgi:hypothetical protein
MRFIGSSVYSYFPEAFPGASRATSMQVGGPRRVPRPLAIRSSTSIACSTGSRSAFNSANIFVTSISSWPLIFFLHGAGERGDNGLASTELGLGRAIRLHFERFPDMVVIPQCRKKILWTQMLWLQKS